MNQKTFWHGTVQDFAMLSFLLAITMACLLVNAADAATLAESYIMLFGTGVGVVLACFSGAAAPVLLLGFQLLAYTSFKLYQIFAFAAPLAPQAYGWLLVPPAAVGSMLVFQNSRRQTQKAVEQLRRQASEQVMLDPLTGLYNLPSFYHDTPAVLQYAGRNSLPVTLLIVHLRYGQELRRLLRHESFEQLKKQLSQTVASCIRLEDRLYSVGTEGELAALLTCAKEVTPLVQARIREAVEHKDFFRDSHNRPVEIRLQMACLQYSKEMGDDMLRFKDLAERELAYDV